MSFIFLQNFIVCAVDIDIAPIVIWTQIPRYLDLAVQCIVTVGAELRPVRPANCLRRSILCIKGVTIVGILKQISALS